VTDIYKNGQWIGSIKDRVSARLDDPDTLASAVTKLIERAALSPQDMREAGLLDPDEHLENTGIVRGRIRLRATVARTQMAVFPFTTTSPSLNHEAYSAYQDCNRILHDLPTHQRDAVLMNLLAAYAELA
jgi:hypothetical protein